MDIYRLAQHISVYESDEHYLHEFRGIKSSYVNTTVDKENRTLLHLAATNSNKRIIQLLSPSFQNVDCEDISGFTPGFVAAMNGLSENVEFLVSKGADIEHRTKPAPSPRLILSDSMLLNDPIERSKKAFWYSTMLHAATAGGHINVVRYLLKINASLGALNGVNMTALELAAQNGHLNIMQLLYENGAHIGHESLQYAAAGGHEHVVKFLLKAGVTDECMRCDGSFYWLHGKIRYQAIPFFNSTNIKAFILSDDRFKIHCQSALHLAIAGNHFKVVKMLLNRSDKTVNCVDFTGRTPLHEAVRQNNIEIARLLIQRGARVSQKCKHFQNLSSPHWSREKCKGDGALYYTKRFQLSCLEKAIYEEIMEKIKNSQLYKRKYPLLSSKEEVEYDEDLCHCGSTPFLHTARYGHVKIASLLLRHGAQPHEQDCQGATPVHVAACHGHYNFIRWLISQKLCLHINVRSKNQSTPLHSGAICKTNKDLKPLMDMGASIYNTDQYGMTPLHYTVLNPFEKVSEMAHCTTFLNISLNDSFNEFSVVWSSDSGYTLVKNSHVFIKRGFVNFQCHKLLQLSKSGGILYINKADGRDKTALHLAAQYGEECSVTILLQQGSRTYLTDNNDKTPLDIAIEFAPNLSTVTDILYQREAYLTQKCEPEGTFVLHRAFERGQVKIAYHILSMNGSLECKDLQGRTPLLIYLQNGGKFLDVVLKQFNVTVHIECGKPFNRSEFHLLAFRKPTVTSDSLLDRYKYDSQRYISKDGPLEKAVKAHPLGFRLINECRDAEGYTVLHRAAQGGNLHALKKFISWGANPTLLTHQGYSALDLAVMSSIGPFPSSQARHAAEETADFLLRATRRISRFYVGCNSSRSNLTIYHLSAYGGLSGFVKTVLRDSSLLGVDVNCRNVHDITPLYLAKLHVGTHLGFEDEGDPWQEIVDVIEGYGGVLSHPNHEVELNVLYKHLFAHHLEPFTLDPFESHYEQFYKSDVSHCREHDLNRYKTGTMSNPYEIAVNSELLRTVKSRRATNSSFHLISRNQNKQQTIETLRDERHVLWKLSRLIKDVSESFKTINTTVLLRNINVRGSNNQSLKLPKIMEQHFRQDFLRDREELNWQEQVLRVVRYQLGARKRIISRKNKRLKYLLHKHNQVFGDTTTFLKLLKKYEKKQFLPGGDPPGQTINPHVSHLRS